MSTLTGIILADFTTTLATAGVVGGTTLTLQSATDDDAVALPSGVYYFTIDGANSSKEHIQCSLVGTALTDIKSVSRQGVMTTGLARTHRLGASVTLTDFAHLKVINDLINGTTLLNSSVPLGYDGAPASLTGNQLATVTYVLGVVNGGAVTFDLQIISGQTSGEALAINDIVYFKESDAKWYKVDADLTTTFDQLQMGVNKTTAAGTGITIQVAISGPVTGFSGLTPGSKYYASNTAGAITTTAGTYSVFVGWALSATILLFNPIYKTLPTQKEKDALVGSQGIPTSSNKYVTQDNTTDGLIDQEQSTQNGTVELGEADATTKKNKIAQSFIPAKTKIRGVNIYKSANTGTFTGTVTVSIQADSSGSPSGSALATKTFTNSEWLLRPVGNIEVIFASEYASLTVDSLYWIVIETSTSDNSNHPNVGTNTAGGYASGSTKYKNTTDGWVAIVTIDLYFKTLEGTASQVVLTNTSGKIESTFYDINELPPIVYQQQIPYPVAYTTFYGFGAAPDGSAFYIVLNNANTLHRYERDTATGTYIKTHEVSIGGNFDGHTGVIQIGSYVYLFKDDNINLVSYRFLAADLTGSTLMTVPTVASSNQAVGAWTDGTYAYVVTGDTPTTSRKWSVSGTTWSAVSTATVTTGIFYTNGTCSVFDGENTYIIDAATANTIYIRKLTSPDGTSYDTTTKLINDFDPNNLFGVVGIPQRSGSGVMYVGHINAIYNATTAISYALQLIPVTKP